MKRFALKKEEKDLEHQINEGLSAQAITRDRVNII
jgi:hypothetical protein